jgi:hypothetical protein
VTEFVGVPWREWIHIQDEYGSRRLARLLEHVVVGDIDPGVDRRKAEARGFEIHDLRHVCGHARH